jgi:hypothetical protein
MALQPCPDCGNEVSDKAAACPKCGHPIEKPKRVESKSKRSKKRSKRAKKKSEPIEKRPKRGCCLLVGLLGTALILGSVGYALVFAFVFSDRQRAIVREQATDTYARLYYSVFPRRQTSREPSAAKRTSSDPPAAKRTSSDPPAAKRKSQQAQAAKRKSQQAQAEFSVRYPCLRQGTFFPALFHLYGVTRDFAELTVKNNTGHRQSYRVEVVLEGLSTPAAQTVVVAANSTGWVKLSPTISKAIANTREERPGKIRATLFSANGQILASREKQVTIASRNDFPFSEGFELLGVFVTPNDPVADRILSAARHYTSDKTIGGYLEPPTSVLEEVRAIYLVLSELGVGYRNAARTLFADRGLVGQKVYFPSETVGLTAGNCIDGTCLFASVLEKAGIRPFIVIVPGHAFLAVKLGKNDSAETVFVETTLLGTAPFEAAILAGTRGYAEADKKKATLLDIFELRRKGIKPFPLSFGSGKLNLPSQKTFMLRLLGLRVANSDFPAGGSDPGGAPELVVKVFKNQISTPILDTSQLVAKDAWAVDYRQPPVAIRLVVGRSDLVSIRVYDKDAFGRYEEISSLAHGLAWPHFIGRSVDFQSPGGSAIEWDLSEIK